MKKKVLIIGAGWFGCHLFKNLNRKKYSLKIFEKNNSIFSSQSGFNSNRLHMGFHYPRASKTRHQCVNGFVNFKKKYRQLTQKINKNYIAIHDNSLISFKNYKKILKSSGLKFQEVNNVLNLKNTKGIIQCNEELIVPSKSKNFFLKFFKTKKNDVKFNKNIKNIISKKNKVIIENQEYDCYRLYWLYIIKKKIGCYF